MNPLYMGRRPPHKQNNHTVDAYTIPTSIGKVGCWLWHAAPSSSSKLPLKIGAEISRVQ